MNSYIFVLVNNINIHIWGLLAICYFPPLDYKQLNASHF